MRICYELPELAFPIKIEQSESGRKLFTVTYGKQVKARLTYSQAAHEFGECVFHALACEGLLDNEGA